jgi:hypothetical protein
MPHDRGDHTSASILECSYLGEQTLFLCVFPGQIPWFLLGMEFWVSGKGLKELETNFVGEQERMKMSETTDTQIQTYLSSISDSYIYEEVWLS